MAKYLITEPKDILFVMNEMNKRGKVSPYNKTEPRIKLMKIVLDNTRKQVLRSTMFVPWRTTFITLGSFALQQLDSLIEFEPAKFAEFLLAKHKLYGAEPFEDWREVGILMRLGSKVSRLLNLYEDLGVDNNGESALDTLKDVLGYCILGCYIERLPK